MLRNAWCLNRNEIAIIPTREINRSRFELNRDLPIRRGYFRDMELAADYDSGDVSHENGAAVVSSLHRPGCVDSLPIIRGSMISGFGRIKSDGSVNRHRLSSGRDSKRAGEAPQRTQLRRVAGGDGDGGEAIKKTRGW